MDLSEVVARVVQRCLEDYFEDTQVWRLPALRPPASEQQIIAFERLSGQEIDADLGAFLRLTDGMDGFYFTMSILGCTEWDAGSNRTHAAREYLDSISSGDVHEDVGLESSVKIFPVAVNADASDGIFLIKSSVAPERIWWTGQGSSRFFHTFRNLLEYSMDRSLYSPRDCVD
ncbi:SMI1/KNR4 family protein [Streptomyces virginiae]|uniref:SMI1/KNR4 family protein n=1 Tax=Streptomyces virginiae TaxID=1961 RepID=UPI00224DF9DD|nr:SMI1/KNR4 family protein [Streptomyces virginiae]MCX4721869.1 SMI1/KNR4 family protein [Streptomyces virginiae]